MNTALKIPPSSLSPRPSRPRTPFRHKPNPAPLFFPEREGLDEKMPETPRHLHNRTDLWQSACEELAGLGVIGCDQFLYPDPNSPKKNLAPDLFLRLGAPGPAPPCWKTWIHGRPDLAVEIISPSDATMAPWQQKMKRYRLVAVRELFRFDAENAKAPLQAWDWIDDDLVERELDDPRCAESALLQLYFVVVQHPQHGPFLRLARDPKGQDLIQTPKERALIESERARVESERARVESERARVESERADRAEHAVQEEGLRAQRQLLQTLLTARGLGFAGDAEQRITACQDPALLQRWFLRAVHATSLAELFTDER